MSAAMFSGDDLPAVALSEARMTAALPGFLAHLDAAGVMDRGWLYDMLGIDNGAA